MLLSGYCKVPNRRMYWQDRPDTHNKLVANSIRRDQIDAIISCLHFSDNSIESEDRFKKVRLLFMNLNECSLKYIPPSQVVSVDECMVPYYGPHGDKQYICGKPIR